MVGKCGSCCGINRCIFIEGNHLCFVIRGIFIERFKLKIRINSKVNFRCIFQLKYRNFEICFQQIVTHFFTSSRLLKRNTAVSGLFKRDTTVGKCISTVFAFIGYQHQITVEGIVIGLFIATVY